MSLFLKFFLGEDVDAVQFVSEFCDICLKAAATGKMAEDSKKVLHKGLIDNFDHFEKKNLTVVYFLLIYCDYLLYMLRFTNVDGGF